MYLHYKAVFSSKEGHEVSFNGHLYTWAL